MIWSQFQDHLYMKYIPSKKCCWNVSPFCNGYGVVGV